MQAGRRRTENHNQKPAGITQVRGFLLGMDLSGICRLLALTGLVQLLLPAAADLSPLNCSVSRLPTRFFRYQLSQWTASDDCDTQWADRDVVIAQGSSVNESLVENVTVDHIDLKICHPHLMHVTKCLKVKQTSPTENKFDWTVDCRVNCSLLELDDVPPPTKFCFSESVCVDSLTAFLFPGAAVAVILVGLIIWFAVHKYKLRKSATANSSYSPPTQIQTKGHVI
ncbi:uncharacterized protein LOC106954336 [Poecilia latipinna]|uniref:uncharacterized protein LOC106954336 n=1 Tax=Poecilia latipinna TaxID=48699 RepID=UPI00072DFF0E|nr:PREDICTED: uncharacterized protein LOC106954336 [Poecilia latipinna]